MAKRTLPRIRRIFKRQFPVNFRNEINGWGCPTDEELAAAKAEFEAKNPGKPFVYMIDMHFGRHCMNNCPNCFTQCRSYAGDPKDDLCFIDHINFIYSLMPYGLRYVKVLGLGEPFDEHEFILFLEILNMLGLEVCVFTKTSVFADNNLCRQIHGCTSWELAKRVAKLNVTILVGFNAIDWDVQEQLVVSPKGNYASVRNQTLKILAKAGMNKSNPSRVGLGSSPMTLDNIKDMAFIYKWARERNFYVIICPTMCVGNCKQESFWRAITPSLEEQVKVYTEISRFNIDRGIWTLEDLLEKGLPPYAGMIRCTQVFCGVCFNLQGAATYCPGSDVILGNIREESIETIVARSPHFGKVRDRNVPCQAKHGLSMPPELQERVFANLRKG